MKKIILFTIGLALLIGPVVFFGSWAVAAGDGAPIVLVMFLFLGGWLPMLGSIWFFRLARQL